MIKAIFFDIDGTLMSSQSRALESTKQAIAAAQAKGILCGIATGRGPVDLAQRIDHLPMDMYVTYNGQLVFTDQLDLYRHPFEAEVLAEIVRFADEEFRQIIFGGRTRVDGSYLMQQSQGKWLKRLAGKMPTWFPVRASKKMMQKINTHRKPGRYSKLAIIHEPVYQCVLYSAESEEAYLRKRLPNCSFQRSNPYSVDIIPKGGSKLLGIQQFLSQNDLRLEEVMAFGDHLNDIEMLQGVAIGVAMGNAQTETKAAADFVTKTNDDDGIYYALKHYGII